MNMEDPCNDKPPQKKRRNNHKDTVCRHYGLTGHSRTTNKNCLHYKAPKKAAAAPADTYQQEESDADASSDLDVYEAEEIQIGLLWNNLQTAAQQKDVDANAPNSSDAKGVDDEIQTLNVLNG
jgi:hypothetical protein